MFSTPSGNFGNLTAGLMAKRAGLPIDAVRRRDQRQRRRAGVSRRPAGSSRAPSVQTMANAMDVGNPSNFERMSWLYGGDLDAMRRDIAGSRHTDDEVRATIRRVYEERGYLLDPHSAIGYLGLKAVGQVGRQVGRPEVAGHVSRDRASGEVRRDRRADHRPVDPKAAAAGRRAGDEAEDSGDRCDARCR